jgi:hypothetical protein
VHELMFNIEAEKFQITYHRENSKIAPSTREFIKPPNWNDKGSTWTWNNDFHNTYQVSLDQLLSDPTELRINPTRNKTERLATSLSPKKTWSYFSC